MSILVRRPKIASQLFKWSTKVSRFVCWLLVASACLLIFNTLGFLTGVSETPPPTQQLVAIPLYICAILLLYYRLRLAIGAFSIFLIIALIEDFSVITVTACAIVGFLLFSHLMFLPSGRVSAKANSHGLDHHK